MKTRVVSISRQVGTAGEEVAQAVAEKLSFRYIPNTDYVIRSTE